MPTDVPDPGRYDCLLAADFTQSGDLAYRLAQEARFLHAQGLQVGLLQSRQPDAGEIIHAEIQTCIRRGVASVAPAGIVLEISNLIIHGPSTFDWDALPSFSDRLAKVFVICHCPADLTARKMVFGASTVQRSFATNDLLRSRGAEAFDQRDWLPPPQSTVSGQTGDLQQEGKPFAIGWLSAAGMPHQQIVTCLQAHSACALSAEHFDIGVDPFPIMPDHSDAVRQTVVKRLPPLSLDRYVHGLDAVVFMPSDDSHTLPDTLVAAALSAEVPVFLPTWLKGHYGRGPVYSTPGGLAAALKKCMTASRKRKATASFVSRTRLAPITGLVPPARVHDPAVVASVPADDCTRPILCLAANGVGIGHLTRLLAIARRMSAPVVFVTQAPAVGVVQDFGFPVHYISSAATVGGNFDVWDDWLKTQLDVLFDMHDPSLVIYDGNHPSWGLIGSVVSRRDCRLAWVRRGMWANTTSAFLSNARWCDMVIEPADLAEARDDGVTAARRHEVIKVDPIRLLEASELLDRVQASALLGLNPARPAVLIQLGSGYNRDLLALLDQIITMASAFPGLQICLAEWVTGTVPLTLWPHVTVLRGFPISQYIRAFDFCISASGYNSFHELIGFGVPTVFLANNHPSMDDQSGRAKFAQDAAAAFELSGDDLSELPDLLTLLMQDAARRFLTERCNQFDRPNGAIAAAGSLAALARSSDGVAR